MNDGMGNSVPIFELSISVDNLKPKLKWFFQAKIQTNNCSIELPPCSVAAADRERPLDVVVALAASAFLSGPAKRLLAPNMFILDAVLC